MKMPLLKTFLLLLCLLPLNSEARDEKQDKAFEKKVIKVLRAQVLKEAAWALVQEPETVTAAVAERSAGGRHDFYSEGDYWWPDPENQDGPYLQRDGMTNPDNFVAHREAMIRFSRIVGALASAYKITGDATYAKHAFRHLSAWFVDPETLMNPSLNFAQAIKGRVTGRGIGIIDTIHLMEVAQGVLVMENAPGVDQVIVDAIRNWFREYTIWLTTHPYGHEEMNWKNNHATCWAMQVASFARLTGDRQLLSFCRSRYKDILLPNQMATDGSFPLELARTKTYGYSLFNLDAMTMLVYLLSDSSYNLWEYTTPDGKSIQKGIAFLYPYVAQKSKWPFARDVMYWEHWPVAQPFLLFGAKELNHKAMFKTWKNLEHAPREAEIIRNLPIRNPLIWL
ncbi:alginate lyase family protein [Pontibacter beigongshangensis]|uniref:alginate lyase family protein n=1 Tax=Pontibacter beigongshangensis TaxID=2574733 RepID=UPI001F50DCBA|nr:alginate lyase family protein [Pontibacter beigongshangensis]